MFSSSSSSSSSYPDGCTPRCVAQLLGKALDRHLCFWSRCSLAVCGGVEDAELALAAVATAMRETHRWGQAAINCHLHIVPLRGNCQIGGLSQTTMGGSSGGKVEDLQSLTGIWPRPVSISRASQQGSPRRWLCPMPMTAGPLECKQVLVDLPQQGVGRVFGFCLHSSLVFNFLFRLCMDLVSLLAVWSHGVLWCCQQTVVPWLSAVSLTAGSVACAGSKGDPLSIGSMGVCGRLVSLMH